jgi:Uma2 family endonuclease
MQTTTENALLPVVLHFQPFLEKMSDDEFYEFCRLNRELRIERTSDGDLVIMAPAGGESGRRNFSLTGAFSAWVEQDGSGVGFDSSTGFTLPSGAVRSPDVAWVKRSRWEKLGSRERERFPPICPDFVVELRSATDSPAALQAKMAEYIACGALLGWLIDPLERRVRVYRQGAPLETLEDPETLSGDPVLPGFVLDLRRLW